MSDDLVAFLNARLNEDEQVAREAQEGPPEERWRAKGYDQVVQRGYRAPGVLGDPHLIAECGPMGVRRVRHITRHDPARVLREVEAKRAILAVHQPLSSMYGEPPCCGACWPQPRIGTHPLWPCSTVRAVAAAYSNHADYRPEWKP